MGSTWRSKVVVEETKMVYTIWYLLYGVEYMEYSIWCVLLEVQGRYNQDIAVVTSHL